MRNTAIVVSSQTNLSEWQVTPGFDTSKNGSPIVDVDVQYKGASVPAESVTISFGNSKTQLKELKNRDHIVIGTSYGNSKEADFRRVLERGKPKHARQRGSILAIKYSVQYIQSQLIFA